MGNRLFFYLSLSSVLLLGVIQATQPWRQDSIGLQRDNLLPAGTETPSLTNPGHSGDPSISIEVILFDQEMPDQGRPHGRVRGGGSR